MSRKRGSTSKKRISSIKNCDTSKKGHYIMTTIPRIMQST